MLSIYASPSYMNSSGFILLIREMAAMAAETNQGSTNRSNEMRNWKHC